MISEQAGLSLRRAWQKAGRLRLARRPGEDSMELSSVAPQALLAKAPDMALITISSLHMRLLVMLGVHDSQAARDYYGEDAFGEIANLTCGVISHELQQAFPDLGMSTPCPLRAASLPWLLRQQPQWGDAWQVRINDAVQVSALLCLFGDGEIDFHLDVQEDDLVGAGELELF